jgi:hypothetical protein
MEKSIFGNELDVVTKFADQLKKMNTISELFKTAKTVEDLNAINIKLTQIMKDVKGLNTDKGVYKTETK